MRSFHLGKRNLKWIFLGCVVVAVIFQIVVIFVDFPETRTVHMVCLTQNPRKPSPFPSEGVWFAGDRTYELPSRWCDKVQKHITIYTESPPLIPIRHLGGFTVYYQHLSELPSSHKIIEHQTAYFLGNPYDSSPENFFHFTKQIYFPLYWLIKSTNQLHKEAENIVFYPFVYAICHSGKYWYHDMFRYEYFKQILHIKTIPESSAYVDTPNPHNVCYRNAVFSSEIFLDKAREAIDYFKGTLNVSDSFCSPNVLVIMDRTGNRRILNMNALKEVGKSLGYDTRVVLMEKLTLREQAQLVHCAKVLAGVTGAGLQWAFFMKDYSGVVEIGWPHKDWPFFFTGQGRYQSGERDVIRPLKFVQVSRTTCHLNAPALKKYWKELFYTNATFTDEESLAILKDERNYHFWKNGVSSLGKMCDVVVEPDAFREALISVGK